MITIAPVTLRSWIFPEDKVAGKEAFLAMLATPIEHWIRAYAWTVKEATNAVIATNAIVPQHLAVDHEQCQDPEQLTQIKELVAAGVEVTILTSTEGERYISHSKALVGVDGSCWEGSTNFSESAWLQTNTAFQFNSPEWRDAMIAQFNKDVAWAWANEPQYQLMSAQPEPATA